jgi:hypothetical protein
MLNRKLSTSFGFEKNPLRSSVEHDVANKPDRINI